MEDLGQAGPHARPKARREDDRDGPGAGGAGHEGAAPPVADGGKVPMGYPDCTVGVVRVSNGMGRQVATGRLATASTSTRAPLGSAATANVDRAGGGSGKIATVDGVECREVTDVDEEAGRLDDVARSPGPRPRGRHPGCASRAPSGTRCRHRPARWSRVEADLARAVDGVAGVDGLAVWIRRRSGRPGWRCGSWSWIPPADDRGQYGPVVAGGDGCAAPRSERLRSQLRRIGCCARSGEG